VLHSRLAFAARSAWWLIHPPTSAIATPVAGVAGPRWIYDPEAFTQDRLAEHRRVVTALRDVARNRHVPLAVILMPEREQVYGQLSDLPNRMVSAMLGDLGLPVIDLLPKLRQAAASRPHLWHEITEGHLSPEGHQVVARSVAEWLVNQPAATTPFGRPAQ
jgi:lysophospholipase L1-like esterase